MVKEQTCISCFGEFLEVGEYALVYIDNQKSRPSKIFLLSEICDSFSGLVTVGTSNHLVRMTQVSTAKTQAFQLTIINRTLGIKVSEYEII